MALHILFQFLSLFAAEIIKVGIFFTCCSLGSDGVNKAPTKTNKSFASSTEAVIKLSVYSTSSLFTRVLK